MKPGPWLLLLCVGAIIILLPARSFAQCDGERWSVKTGTDANAGLVNLSSPTPTTLTYLTSLTAPNPIPDNSRVQPTETTLFVINATLKQYQKQADSDYHLLLIDGAGHQMIAEIASPNCVSQGSPFSAGTTRARAQFDAKFTATSALKTANVPVQITGVGFFDHIAGQAGVAPNGIELHPIIDIIFPPASDFAISASPSTLSVAKGKTITTRIATTISGSFNSSIVLSASGLPSGAKATFSPASIAAPGSGSTTVTFTAGLNTPTGTYNVVVTGTGGGKTHTRTVSLTVTAAGGPTQKLLGNPGFEKGINGAPWTGSTGVIDNSTLQPARTGAWKAWMNGFGTAHTDTLSQQVSIPANATSATLSFWLFVNTAETSTTTAYDTLKVQIRSSAGAVLATLATYSNLSPKFPYTQDAFDITSFKGQTIQVYLLGVEDQGLQTSFIIDDFALDVATSGPVSDFALASSPSTLTVARGNAITTTITTTLSGSFNSGVALSASGLPSKAKATFSPVSIGAPESGSSILTLTAGSTTPLGTYNVVVTGTGGGKTHTTTISIAIRAPGETQKLLINPGFENGVKAAPWIASVGIVDNSSQQPAHSGAWKAWMNGFGSAHTDTLSQQVGIPANATKATLSFWLFVNTAETSTTTVYDTLKVQIRNSAGAVLATLATYSNLSTTKVPYAQATFDITSFKGQTIQVYLLGVEDQGRQTSFIVDDFTLSVIE